ncbi:Radical SAM domain protein [Pyrolobus fumarii 1A]|uniref:Radical SAM domain protein n=1 Tax=Pyrolobus fumarii (strain DSM 11204 / 1A) TaxID=694429 RepID=G0EC94_PYRF1|nr:radical SAM protein [Pyrolobus fumarii]AEM39464.1 Radical SAM domain protein [Pyrolobus fumarii 1A]
MARVIVVDALAREHGKRMVTVDVIGVGPRAVAGLIEKLGVRASLYPLEAVLEEPSILAEYDAMFVSAMSSDKPAAQRLAKLWKRFSNGPSVIGGPVSIEIGEALRLGYDYAVIGEAEVVLPNALKPMLKRDNDVLLHIKGVAFTRKGRIVFTGKPPYASRETLNYIHYTDIRNYDAYWAARVYVEVVRGCSNWRRPRGRLPDGRVCIHCEICTSAPLRARIKCPVSIQPGCGYCSVPVLYGPARSREVDTIVEEVKRLIDLGVTRVVLSAPDFLDYKRDVLVEPEPLTDPCNPPANINAIRELLEALFDKIPEFAMREAYLMIENVKACLVDERVAKVLGEYLRGTPVHIGVETGSDNHMWMLGRPITTTDAKRAVSLLRSAGLEPYVYFIYGLPWENSKVVHETIMLMEELWKLGATKVTAYRFRPLPGTAFQDYEPPVPGSESYAILAKARELNRAEKGRWLGRVVRGIVAGWHPAKKMLVVYPLPHGPVTLVRGPRGLIGWLVKVEITGVISDRMLKGRIVSRIRRVARRSDGGLRVRSGASLSR